MKDRLEVNLNKIPLPENLDERIEKGFNRAKKEESIGRRWPKALAITAAVVTILATSIGIIGLDKVEAAIKQALQYVPGYNIVVDREVGEILALKDPVIYRKNNVFINIKAASKLGSHLNISVESNLKLGDETKDYVDIHLKDREGKTIKYDRWSTAAGGEFWQGDYYFKVDEDEEAFILEMEGHEIFFTLEKTKEVESLRQLGGYHSKKGIHIVAIKKMVEDRLMVSLLNQSDEKTIYEYPFEENLIGEGWGKRGDLEKSMYIIDDRGQKLYPQIPSSFGNSLSDFYFNTVDKEGLELVLPYVKVIYDDLESEKVKIKKPKDGEIIDINKRVSLGEFEIEILDIKNKGEELVVSLDRSEEHTSELQSRGHLVCRLL